MLCHGPRTDFRGKLFPGCAERLAIADSPREVRTICHCGAKTDGARTDIEKSVYDSLCRKHWEEETGRWVVS